jgi:hypothetical protein
MTQLGLNYMQIEKIYDSSKRSNHGLTKPKMYDGNIPALHLAAASGVPEVLRMFITKEFDPIKLTPHKRTPIHFAIDSSTAIFNNDEEEVEVEEKSNDTNEESKFMTNPGTCVDPFAKDTAKIRFDNKLCPGPAGDDEGRPACITMLMQAGVDIWQEDDEDTLAEPGPEASPIVRKWWYEAIARDTSEPRKTSMMLQMQYLWWPLLLQLLHMWVHYNLLLGTGRLIHQCLIWCRQQSSPFECL